MIRYKLKDLSLSKLEYGSGAAACMYDGITRYVRITDIDDEGNLGADVVSPNLVDEKYLLYDGDVLTINGYKIKCISTFVTNVF